MDATHWQCRGNDALGWAITELFSFPICKGKNNRKGERKFFGQYNNSYPFTDDPTLLTAMQRDIEHLGLSGVKVLKDILARLRI